MITTDKVTEIFCVLDDFCKNLDTELTKDLHIAPWTRDESLCGIGCILFLRE